MNTIRRLALRRLLRKPLPKNFSLDAETVIREKYDVFGVRGNVGGAEDVLLREFVGDTVTYKYWVANTPSQDGEGRIDDIEWDSLRVVHQYRTIEIRYSSVWEAVVNDLFGFGWFRWKSYSYRNKELPYFNNRMRLLHLVVRRWRETSEVTLEYLLDQVYESKIFDSEHLYTAKKDIKFLLDALEASGDIELDSDVLGYVKPTPNALNTLAEYETTKIRHEDTLQLSRYQLWVAVAVALVAFVALLKEWW